MKPNNKHLKPLTDSGNAERLIEHFGSDFRFSKTKGDLTYTGTHWMPDEKDSIFHQTLLVARSIQKEEGWDCELEEAVRKHARRSESLRARQAMLKLARSEPRVAIETAELDNNPWLFNVLNGTIELNNGVLRNHRRTDLITKISPVSYEQAPCPRFDEFLERVQPDPDMRAFLKRLAGYAMTGVIKEHVLPINYGNGRNGKSVFVDTILHVLGGYAKQVPTELLIVKHFDAHPTERATLHGCRFAAASETDQARKLNVALVKQLTGGDRISARFMRRDFFDFAPTHKLMLSTNNKPEIEENTDAIWERVLLIPWNVTIPERERDLDLKAKLQEEAPGILHWMVEGCLEWQKQGLNPPVSVVAATQAYRKEQNNVTRFIDELCEREFAARTSTVELYAAYQRWCALEGATPVRQASFVNSLQSIGINKMKSNGLMIYRGIRPLQNLLRDKKPEFSRAA